MELTGGVISIEHTSNLGLYVAVACWVLIVVLAFWVARGGIQIRRTH
jgi:hypothetical protein